MAERPPRVVKFVKVEVTQIGTGRCRAVVELKRDSRKACIGSAEGAEADKLLCVAHATASALLEAARGVKDSVRYGLKINEIAIRNTFGKPTVLVSAAGTLLDQQRELLGVCLVESDPVRAAALSVMSAANRFLGVG